MSQDVSAILDKDVGFHSYALRDILTDFQERFGASALQTALNETLPKFDMEAISYAEHSSNHRRAA